MNTFQDISIENILIIAISSADLDTSLYIINSLSFNIYGILDTIARLLVDSDITEDIIDNIIDKPYFMLLYIKVLEESVNYLIENDDFININGIIVDKFFELLKEEERLEIIKYLKSKNKLGQLSILIYYLRGDNSVVEFIETYIQYFTYIDIPYLMDIVNILYENNNTNKAYYMEYLIDNIDS